MALTNDNVGTILEAITNFNNLNFQEIIFQSIEKFSIVIY